MFAYYCAKGVHYLFLGVLTYNCNCQLLLAISYVHSMHICAYYATVQGKKKWVSYNTPTCPSPLQRDIYSDIVQMP